MKFQWIQMMTITKCVKSVEKFNQNESQIFRSWGMFLTARLSKFTQTDLFSEALISYNI